MFVSQKCQYALRAVYELARIKSNEPMKIHKIADAQQIPPRFLEVILNQLKHSGWVDSRRGKEGGYILTCKPQELTVGEIVRLIQGPIVTIDRRQRSGKNLPLRGDYAFTQLWENVKRAVSDIYDNLSFADLIELERNGAKHYITNYAI